jgi:hypothetical protein
MTSDNFKESLSNRRTSSIVGDYVKLKKAGAQNFSDLSVPYGSTLVLRHAIRSSPLLDVSSAMS